jgi:hypothetical protein
LLALSIRLFLQEAFVCQRREIGIRADEIQKIIIIVDVFDGKIGCIRNIWIQLNDFKARSLIFSSNASYSSWFLGLESFNFDISALK